MSGNPPAARALATVYQHAHDRPQHEQPQQPPAAPGLDDQRPPAAASVAARAPLSLRFSDPDAEVAYAFCSHFANANRHNDLYFQLFINLLCVGEWASQLAV